MPQVVTLTSDFNSSSWSMSIFDAGEVVTGFEDLKQQVLVALTTDKFSVPFDPPFGFNINELLDKPVNFVIPNGKLGILETLQRDVPAVDVKRIEHTLTGPDFSHVTFHVFCATNLGNFVVEFPMNPTFPPTIILGGFSGGFSSGFNI